MSIESAIKAIHAAGLSDTQSEKILSNDQIRRIVELALSEQWQPIESAPKDGQTLILWLRSPWSVPRIAYWFEPWHNWQPDGVFPDDREDEISGIGAAVPTHWQPLPKSPETK